MTEKKSELDIAKAIIKAAMEDADEDHGNAVEDVAWTEIEHARDRIAAIHFAYDAGIISIEYKFLITTNRDFSRALWNEFADEIVGGPDVEAWVKANSMPDWKLEIVNTPRAKKPDAMAWHDKRLRRANLPLRVAAVQLGEIFGGKIEWEPEVHRDVDLEWDNGITSDAGEFKGWDEDRQVYLRFNDSFENNELVMRVAL